MNHVPITRPEALIRADAMQYVVFERADIDRMESFLLDFGFMRSEAPGAIRYYRGHGPAPFLVAVIPSDKDAFSGFGMAASSKADLETLAAATGAAIEDVDTPGGGWRVTLTDPTGLRVDLVHGFEPVEEMPFRSGRPFPFNSPHAKARVNSPVRPELEPSPIFKLGHVVLQRPDFLTAIDWYMRHFGFIGSDVQYLPSGKPGLGFFRLDRAEKPADHHSLALLGGPGASLLHVSFETFDIDALGQGGQYLQARGWQHFWGIGRHALGSQMFDYFKDPAGDEWEHYIDGDVMDASYPTNYIPLTRGSLWQWGADLPESMRPPMTPDDVEKIHAEGGLGNADAEQVKGLMQALQPAPRFWLE